MTHTIAICGGGSIPAHVVGPPTREGRVYVVLGTAKDVLDIPGSAYINLLDASMELADSLRQVELSFRITSEDLASLKSAIAKFKPDDFPEEKILLKPYKSHILKPQNAANNFKRSGFAASRNLARGRI